jgi:hypothetical protein
VVRPEVLVLGGVAQHVVRGDEHRGRDGEDGFLGSAPGLEGQKLATQIAVTWCGRRPRRR